MTNPPNVTPEMLELLERRLADNVGERVERTLKVRYAGIVAAVLFVLGLAGYSWIDNLVVRAIGPVSKDAERTMTEMNVQLDLARENKRKLDALIEQLTADADAAQRRIESFQTRLTKQQEEFDGTLVSINDQLGAVVVRRRELEADLVENRSSLGTTLDETRKIVAELAQVTEDLADLAGDGRAETAERVAALRQQAQSLADRAQQAASGEHLATVFLQYGKSVAPDVARAVGDALRGDGFVVPGEDRMPNDSREVRYFYAEDREAANALAAKTAAALASLGFTDLPVEVRDFTGWAKAKPRAGTLELWLALPEAKAG
ncbi:MAG: hypothetical protein AB7I59_05340 [Geminicoccaceae bacterium]